MAAEIRGPSFKPGVGQNVALYVSPAAVYFALFFFLLFLLDYSNGDCSSPSEGCHALEVVQTSVKLHCHQTLLAGTDA